jgi:hypothetical protein
MSDGYKQATSFWQQERLTLATIGVLLALAVLAVALT